MATVTQSQIAAHEAGRKVNEAAFEIVAPLIKSRYLALKSGSGLSDADLRTPSEGRDFDAYVETLTRDVLEGESERAQKIRAFIAQYEPEKYAQLEKLGTVRNAAAKAAYDNTGDFEFLGGSTVMNALAGLIKWIFNWCAGGIDGLKEIIAEGAAANATASFSENLKQQGIDPTQGFGQDAVAQFAEQAEIKAGLKEPSAKKPFSLADIEVSGLKEEKAVAAQEKPVEAKDASEVPAKLAEHFESVGNAALNKINIIAQGRTQGYETLLAQAKTTLAQKGTELAQQAIAGGKRLPDNFEFAVIRETFRDTLEKIDPKDKQAHDMVGKIVETFEHETTLAAVNSRLRGDTQTAPASLIIDIMNEKLTERKVQLIGIMKTAAAGNQEALDAQAKMVDQQAQEAAQQALLGRRETAKSHVTQALEESFVPLDIQVQIDRGIQEHIKNKYPTSLEPAANTKVPLIGWEIPYTGEAKSWAAGSINQAVHKVGGFDNGATQFIGWAPSADERKQLAGFIAEKMKPIVESEINTRIDGGMQDLPVDGVVKESMQHFDKAFDEAIKDGTLSNTWSAYQSVIRNTMENRLREKLQESKPKLSGILGETSGKVTMRVDPNGAALAMAGVTLDTSNAAVTAPSPGYDARGGRREMSRGGDASRPVGPGALPAPIV